MNDSHWSRRHFLETTGLMTVSGGVLAASHEQAEVQTPSAKKQTSEELMDTDVLICGGGPSGMAAAVMAARQGAKTLLVERYGRLGGMAVHARVAPLMGRSDSPFVQEVLKRIGGVRVDPEYLDLQYADLVVETGADLLLHSWACETMVENDRVTGVRFITKQGKLRVNAKIVVDATGDGDVAYGAGAVFELGRPEDGLLQPMSIMYTVAGVDAESALYCSGERQAKQIKVGDKTWELIVLQAQKAGELPENVGVVRTYRTSRPGEAVINATQVNYVDGTNIHDLTKAELEGRRQAYQILKFLKKHGPGYSNAFISGMPSVIGVRETRRFVGLKYLTREDLLLGRKTDDAVVHNASFVIDIHNPNGAGQAEGLAQNVKPYDIPYGCLVPKEIDGLLLAGRCISGSHDAHASYRVQQIAMAIGSAAGVAAAETVKLHVQPREVDVGRLQSVLFT